MTSDFATATERRERWTFVIVSLLFVFAGQWMRGLWETDEGRYSEVAREMVATGDWMHPTLHGTLHLTKPPGAYWLIAAGLELFGRNEFGARFFLAVAFAASAWFVRDIGTRILGRAAGARAGWIFLTMLLPVASGNTVSTDMFLTLAVLGAIACLVRSWSSERPGGWYAAAGAALGFAFFVKGPPAVLPFAGVLAGWAAGRAIGGFRRERPAEGRALGAIVGALLFAAVGLWWFVWMVREDPSRFEYWVHGEVYERVFTNNHHRDQPFWFYFAVLACGTVPWMWLAIRGAMGIWRTAVGRVLLVWVLLPFVVFELSTSKMWFYLLPLAAPLALLGSRGAYRQERTTPCSPRLLAAWMIVLVGLRTGLAFVPVERDTRQLRDEVTRVEPTGKLPVALLAGRDMWGLQFQYDGRLRYLTHDPLVVTGHADATLTDEFGSRRAAGEDWILIVEPGNGERAVRRVVRGAAETLSTSDDWIIYRVRGK